MKEVKIILTSFHECSQPVIPPCKYQIYPKTLSNPKTLYKIHPSTHSASHLMLIAHPSRHPPINPQHHLDVRWCRHGGPHAGTRFLLRCAQSIRSYVSCVEFVLVSRTLAFLCHLSMGSNHFLLVTWRVHVCVVTQKYTK